MNLSREQFCQVLPSYIKSVLMEFPVAAAPSAGTPSGVTFFDFRAKNTPARVGAIGLDTTGMSADTLVDTLRPLRLKVGPDGRVFCFGDCETVDFGDQLTALMTIGLGFYQGWQLNLRSEILEQLDHSPEAGKGPYLFQYCRERYDPVDHARRELRALNYTGALEILGAVPDHWFFTDEERGHHATEYLVALLAQDTFTQGNLRLRHLNAALHHYGRACTWLPHHQPVYSCMANFWRNAGRPDIGRRLLETVQTILADEKTAEQLATYPDTRPEFPPVVTATYNESTPLRLLFLCHPESDFGSDVLHDGLRRVLGAENVLGYPWKSVLHGGDEKLATGYPCTFQWTDEPVPLEKIVQQAAEGGFDAILYSDTLGTLPREETQQILRAAGDTPVFIVDMWDECGDMHDVLLERDGLTHVAGYFKREMLSGCTYPEPTWPLLFSFPDDRIPAKLSWDNREGIFWAGKLMGGARKLQLGWLEKELPLVVEEGTPYTPTEYAKRVQDHLMGISLPGNGFDTVRYWELPAHGTLLVAERPPLAIPYAFEDGKQAILFETVSELRDKARYYLAHREEAIAIAQAGHRHLREHHTGSARARQCIGQIQKRLNQLRGQE